jgi:hypothetical protein
MRLGARRACKIRLDGTSQGHSLEVHFGTSREIVMTRAHCMVRKLLIAGAAASLIAGPIAAQETTGNARKSAPVSDENELGGDSPLVYLIGIAAVAAAIVFLSEDDDAVSP